MDILKGILATILGFSLYVLFTHPKYLKKRIPKVSAGRIQILPCLEINLKKQTIHLHHWIWLSVILGYLSYIARGIDHLFYVKFFTLGAIIQGFSFKDRFQVFIKKPNVKLTDHPLISVVIPAYNEEKFLGETLRSLTRQIYKPKEIIVVDNGSTDNTAQIAHKYGAKVIYEPHKGVAFARQKGFEETKCQIIASTDADSILPRNWLNRFAQEFMKEPKRVMVSGMYDFYDGGILLRFVTWLFNYRLFAICGWYSGANMAVKKEAFLEIGGFNTSIPLSEDSNLGVRLRKVGKVLRLANFKVKTSARRFNQLGLIGGLWDYSINYIKFKLNIQTEKVSFRAGSEVKEAKLGKLFTYSFGLLIFIFAFIMAPVNPIHAKVDSARKRFSHQVTLTVQKGSRIVTKEISEEISDASQVTKNVYRHLHHVPR